MKTVMGRVEGGDKSMVKHSDFPLGVHALIWADFRFLEKTLNRDRFRASLLTASLSRILRR